MFQRYLAPSAHDRQWTLTMSLASSGLNENGSIHDLVACYFFSNQQFIGDFIKIKDTTGYETISFINSIVQSFARASLWWCTQAFTGILQKKFMGENTFADQIDLDPGRWYMVLGSCRINFRSRLLVLSSPVPSSYSSLKKVSFVSSRLDTEI